MTNKLELHIEGNHSTLLESLQEIIGRIDKGDYLDNKYNNIGVYNSEGYPVGQFKISTTE